jgi:hypothetical protein
MFTIVDNYNIFEVVCNKIMPRPNIAGLAASGTGMQEN